MKIDDLFGCYKMIADMKKDMKLPISMSIVLEDNFMKIEPIMKNAEQKRQELIGSEDYAAKVEELLNTEIDVSLSKIPMKILARCDEDPRYDALNYEQVSIIKRFMLQEDEQENATPD